MDCIVHGVAKSRTSLSDSHFHFHGIARRDKKAFLSDQCKEIEENNRMGKIRDLFKNYQGNISCKDGLNKGQKSFGPNSRRY